VLLHRSGAGDWQVWQALPSQIWFARHWFPQAPQLARSAEVSRHSGLAALVQSAMVAPALQTHALEEQVPSPHRWPHAPQFFASFAVSAH